MQPLLVDDPVSVGPYRLLARLGAGGMGQVFLAADDRRQLVAVKLVHPGLAQHDEFRRRFRREVTAGRQLRGPFVVAVLAADPDAATPWLATEFVPGPSLEAAVATVGPFGVGPARVLAHGLAGALAGIHAAGLVHRDVKPSNVLLGPDRPRLIDFGIARAADATALTSTGAVLGTPAYMSPEQAEGLAVGAASDVFSLGAVLVYAASGRPPFGEGTPAALLVRICDHDPDLGGLPEPLRDPIAACLAKAPGDRPTADQVRDLFGEPTTAAEPGWLPAPVARLASTTLAVGPPPAGTPLAAPGAGRPPGSGGPAPRPLTGDAVPTGRGRRRIGRRTLLAGAGVAGLTAAVGVAASQLVGAREVTVPPAPAAVGPRLLWSTPLGTDTSQYPAVVIALGDQLAYAAADNVVHAIDIDTGTLRWSHACPDVPGLLGYRRSYLAVADGAVVVGTNAVITALDARTGAVRWESALDLDGASPDIAARVTASGGLVHYAYRDALAALDAESGTPRWIRPLGAGAGAGLPSPVVDGGRVFVAGLGLGLEAIDAATGAPVWRGPARDEYRVGTGLVVTEGTLYCWVPSGPSAELAAVDAATGAPRWSVPFGSSASSGERPAVVDGLVVVTVGVDDVHLRALDVATGATRWEGSAADGRILDAGPTVDGDAICCGGSQGQVYVFDAATGTRRWEYTGSSTATGELAFRAGTAYIAGGGGAGRVDAVAGP